MYPRDAQTISFSTKTAGTYTLIPATTTPITVLSGTINDASGNDQSFILGTSSILKSVSGDLNLPMHLVYTNTALRVVKTGTATSTFGVTIVYRNRNKTYDPVLNNLGYGDMLFSLCVIIGILSIIMWRLIFKK